VSSIEESEAVELHWAVLEHVRAAALEIGSVAGKVEDCVAERLAIATDELDSIIRSIYTATLRSEASDASGEHPSLTTVVRTEGVARSAHPAGKGEAAEQALWRHGRQARTRPRG
jgi:hypothetical protein